MLEFIIFVIFILAIIQLCLSISILRTTDEVRVDLLDFDKKLKRIDKNFYKRGKK